ncbi:MAG: hypothetical protein P857_320 [Candidatus Xenolissoclinum pacificiensis L6]|uniref:Uncharacterized protein n=1 Tax=Candidatus Xenolissoclinum pacificiensis L6 TaxID=1401685 RepID=W2UZW5_9RICK|nr:MAG: hypothetical protein P857_320 [Candidatus Xenolissoclinum pacificiensis L6]
MEQFIVLRMVMAYAYLCSVELISDGKGGRYSIECSDFSMT